MLMQTYIKGYPQTYNRSQRSCDSWGTQMIILSTMGAMTVVVLILLGLL
jgi:hypothetical protein